LSAALRDTLIGLHEIMKITRNDWWIISSAAISLYCDDDINVSDVDVLISERDMKHIIKAYPSCEISNNIHTKFRSQKLVRYTTFPLAIEFMCGFHVHYNEKWHRIAPKSREHIILDNVMLFVPEIAELREMLIKFDRPKDKERLTILNNL